MRRILLPLALLLVFTPKAHADQIDDFTLTGDGHTIRFSLPATGVTGISLNPPRLSDHYTASITSATVDGIGGYTGQGDFRFYATGNGDVALGFSNQDLGRSLYFYLYGGESVIGYSSINFPGPYSGTADVFFRLGTFDLVTYDFNENPTGRTPYTLTITPEAATAPEPATLTLLATGALGLLSAVRRRPSF